MRRAPLRVAGSEGSNTSPAKKIRFPIGWWEGQKNSREGTVHRPGKHDLSESHQLSGNYVLSQSNETKLRVRDRERERERERKEGDRRESDGEG